MTTEAVAKNIRTLADLAVGDHAVVTGNNQGDCVVIVVEVDEDRITVEDNCDRRQTFLTADGSECGENPASRLLRLPEEIEARSRRLSAVSRLGGLGFTVSLGRTADISTETFEAMLALITRPATGADPDPAAGAGR